MRNKVVQKTKNINCKLHSAVPVMLKKWHTIFYSAFIKLSVWTSWATKKSYICADLLHHAQVQVHCSIMLINHCFIHL